MTTKPRAASPAVNKLNGICSCGHRRVAHVGALPGNNGGNECSRCDCPLYTEEVAAVLADPEAAIRKRLELIRAECHAILHKENPYRAAHRILRACDEIMPPTSAKETK